MFFTSSYDFVMWSCAILLFIAFVVGPAFYTTPIFGMTPTLILEIVIYISCVCTSHTVIAWNIYKWACTDGFGGIRVSFQYSHSLLQIVSKQNGEDETIFRGCKATLSVDCALHHLHRLGVLFTQPYSWTLSASVFHDNWNDFLELQREFGIFICFLFWERFLK